MASHKVTRSPDGGERLRFWANTAELAALRQLAATHGLTVHQAAKRVVSEWTAVRERIEADENDTKGGTLTPSA